MNQYEHGKALAFDSYCKKIMRNETRKFYREIKRLQGNEILFSELAERELRQLYTYDTYFSLGHSFQALNYKIVIRDDLLADALTVLSEQDRTIVLLSYFARMTDKEIGNKLSLIRATVQYRRNSALRKLRKHIKSAQNGIRSP